MKQDMKWLKSQYNIVSTIISDLILKEWELLVRRKQIVKQISDFDLYVAGLMPNSIGVEKHILNQAFKNRNNQYKQKDFVDKEISLIQKKTSKTYKIRNDILNKIEILMNKKAAKKE